MTDLNHIVKTPEESLDAAFVKLCRSIEAKRARTVIDHILKHGIITNEEVSDIYGYDHPPRAVRDVRENGIPLITHTVVSPKTGRRMGAYTFDDPQKIKHGRIGGRRAFSKQFKQLILQHYGPKDAITGAVLDARYLQIDHRVPYEVSGDNSADVALDPKDFMLLDGSSNRAKSWSCEHCENFLVKRDPAICKRCFWASPEDHDHIAEAQLRRAEIVWNEHEIGDYERIKKQAEKLGIDVPTMIKRLLRE